jgi:RNase P/RNase MRP subunit p29
MIASPEDARLFFDRWKEDRPPLKVRMWISSLFLDAIGTVADFTAETLELAGDSWKFTIPLEGVNFSFSDPREIPVASVRDSELARYEFGIALQLPNGDQVVIMELKASSQPASESDD